MVILCDIDGVCCDLVGEILNRYNGEYNKDLKQTDITNYDMSKILKSSNGIEKYFTKDLYNNIEQIPNSLKYINKLKDLGYRVVYVTSFTKKLAGLKFDWLKKNGYINNLSDYIEAQDKSLINGDILIDDYIKNVLTFPKKGILLSHAWNLNYDFNNRCDNWEDIYNYILNINKKEHKMITKLKELDYIEVVSEDEKDLVIRNKNTKKDFTIHKEFLNENDFENVIDVLNGREPQILDGITRIVGYFSKTSNWNKSKIGELKDRRAGNYKIGDK